MCLKVSPTALRFGPCLHLHIHAVTHQNGVKNLWETPVYSILSVGIWLKNTPTHLENTQRMFKLKMFPLYSGDFSLVPVHQWWLWNLFIVNVLWVCVWSHCWSLSAVGHAFRGWPTSPALKRWRVVASHDWLNALLLLPHSLTECSKGSEGSERLFRNPVRENTLP